MNDEEAIAAICTEHEATVARIVKERDALRAELAALRATPLDRDRFKYLTEENRKQAAELAALRARLAAIADVVGHTQGGTSTLQHTVCTMVGERDALRAERDQWKANHDNQVALRRMLMDRPDLKDRSASMRAIINERDALRAELAASNKYGEQAHALIASLRACLDRDESLAAQNKALQQQLAVLKDAR